MLDLDEMVIGIKNTQVKKYLDEAIKSYKVGNYRSAIITSWIAAMFDMVEKFQILIRDREPTAIAQWRDIEPKIIAHENWETNLINAAKSADMISQYELETLEKLRGIRNKYAHPSFDEVGILFDPTPEEVRYFIRTLFDLILSQPAQLGAFYVNKLLEQIKNSYFFATKPNLDDLTLSKGLVFEKFNKINKKQVRRLIKELFQVLPSPENSDHELNVLCFVINLWGCSDELQIFENISGAIDNYIDSQNIDSQNITVQTLVALISYPEAINKLSNNSKLRIKELFISEILRNKQQANLVKKLLANSDVLDIAKLILDNIDEYFHQAYDDITLNYLYKILGQEKFIAKFGSSVLADTRKALKPHKKGYYDGYSVNPKINLMKQYGFWQIVETHLPDEDKISFAGHIINSLNSNNGATIKLLGFSEVKNIPTKWVTILLDVWSEQLLEDKWRRENHLANHVEQYLCLLYRYKEIFGIEHTKLKEIFTLISSETPTSIESMSSRVIEFELDESLQKLWKLILSKLKPLFLKAGLEQLLHDWLDT